MIEKIGVFLFIFAILFLIKESYLFIQQILKNSSVGEENVVTPYKVPFVRLLFIGITLSYIITCIIKGF